MTKPFFIFFSCKRPLLYATTLRRTAAIVRNGSNVLDERNFKSSIAYHPDMCEYLHTSDFKGIEEKYFSELKLY